MERKTNQYCPLRNLHNIFTPIVDFYSNIKKLLILFPTIPMNTCTSKKSFSSLKIIKTYLRLTSRENRLNKLTSLNIHIHPEIIIKPKEVPIVDLYANKHPRVQTYSTIITTYGTPIYLKKKMFY